MDLGATIVPGGRGKPKPSSGPSFGGGRPGAPSAPPVYPAGAVPGALAAAPLAPLPVMYTTGLPSRAIILKNMFGPDEEEEGWDEDIRDDVKEECERHGPVVHVSVEKASAGHVYVLFRFVLCRAWRASVIHVDLANSVEAAWR